MTIKTYKKTATIDALEWTGTPESYLAVTYWAASYGVLIERQVKYNPYSQMLLIPTLEGPMFASVGDFIAKGINDEFWAIKPDIMTKTYEEI